MGRYVNGGLSDQRKASLKRYFDAKALKQERHWRGAMYLIGYAVECKLKERLMEKFGASTLKNLETILSRKHEREVRLGEHRIEYLFQFLEIKDKLANQLSGDGNLRAFQQCNRWTVDWRYAPDDGTEDECGSFFEAVDRFLKFLSGNC